MPPTRTSSALSWIRPTLPVLVVALAAMGLVSAVERDAPRVISTRNPSGIMRTYSPAGIDPDNPFFKPLGTTGTTCEHCHFAADAWGLSAAHARALFEETNGTHPLFRPQAANDPKQAAALTPESPIEDRIRLYSLLLDKGDVLVRIPLRLPNDPDAPAEFTLVGVDDPSLPDFGKVEVPGVGLVGDPAGYLAYTGGQLWLHRRPLPTTNFEFVTAALWDGRNTPNPNPTVAPVRAGILKVARDTIVSREAPAPGQYTDAELDALAVAMTDLEFSLFTAQAIDRRAGPLDAQGATGGPRNLSRNFFFFGINDVLGDNPSHQTFDPRVFDLYDAWAHAPGNALREARAAVLRGELLFNSKPLHIAGVGGLNNADITLSDGVTRITGPGPFTGTCGSCHDAPDVGNHSTRLPINIGVSDETPLAVGRAAVADLPLFTLRNDATGELVRTTDPGRATRTGKWAHVGEFKGPILRGLAARAPYFHNGMAATLEDVVNFYDARFHAGFTAREKADLVAFLRTL